MTLLYFGCTVRSLILIHCTNIITRSYLPLAAISRCTSMYSNKQNNRTNLVIFGWLMLMPNQYSIIKIIYLLVCCKKKLKMIINILINKYDTVTNRSWYFLFFLFFLQSNCSSFASHLSKK